jgi:preprotein translocase subunit SecD
MRARSIRTSILILVILGLSLASLAFQEININIPGFFELQRGGLGPLGLKLGLDLRGGAHLVYQADVGTRIDATFSQPVNEADTQAVIQGLGFEQFEVQAQDSNTLHIETPLLDDARRQELRAALEEKFGAVETFEVSETEAPTAQQMEGVVSIINRRVNLFGTEEPIVQQFGEDRIIVQLPGASGSVTDVEFTEAATVEELETVLRQQGFTEFNIEEQSDRAFEIRTAVTLSDEQVQELRSALAAGIGSIESFEVTGGIEAAKALIGETAQLEFKERTCTDRTCQTFTDADIGLTGDDLVNAFAATSPNTGEWTVNIEFNSRGTEIFSDLTRRIVNDPVKRIAVFLDDELLIAPSAIAWIRDGRSLITGNFTREEAQTLAIQLESGRLPVPLELVQESEVDALLGSESLEKSLMAGLIGLGLVMVFMIAYYRVSGVVASLSLIFYSILMLAIFKLIPVTLSLPNIGGFILSVGMAVDANVLIFERMKEELRIGRTLSSSIEVGFSRAWSAIRDGNLTTLITCGVLLWFGNRLGGGLINGFALTLAIGVLVSMFTAIVVSRNLLQMLVWIGLGRRANLFSPEGVQRPAQPATGRARTVEGGR